MSPVRLGCLIIIAAAATAGQTHAQPAPVTTASFVGAWALRGTTTLTTTPTPARSSAVVDVRRRPDGALEVTRQGTTWLQAGAQRTTTWTSTECRLVHGTLEVTFRRKDEWATGLADAVGGAPGTRGVNENELHALYSLQGATLRESLTNAFARPPEHFWTGAWHTGAALRRDERATGAALTTLVSHGPQDARYDLVFISEGYREDELPFFRADVRAAVERLKATTPFKEYWRYLNVHRIDLPSKGTGLPGGRGGGPAALGTRLEGAPTDDGRSPSGSRGAIEAAVKRAGIARPEAICVLVNESFRSIAHTGYTFLSAWDPDPAETAVHELGHVIGFLFDEYEEFGPSRWDFLIASDASSRASRSGAGGART